MVLQDELWTLVDVRRILDVFSGSGGGRGLRGAGSGVGSIPRACIAGDRSWPPASTGANRSPTSASRPKIVAMVKSAGSTPAATSSQRSGVATEAARSGRGE
jgi:hypothetical protein